MIVKEIIERDNVNMLELLYVIEEYIFEKKGKRVKINNPSHPVTIQMALNAYNNYAAPYFMKDERIK